MVVLIWNSLMTDDVEYPFYRLLAICISLLARLCLAVLPIYSLGCLFSHYWVSRVLCIFWYHAFADLYFANIFFLSVAVLCILLTVYLAMQFLILVKYHLSIFFNKS